MIYVIIAWTLLTGLLYSLGKRAVSGLSEERFIDLLSLPLISLSLKGKRRKAHWVVSVAFIFGIFAMLALSVVGGFYLSRWQIFLLRTPDSVLIPHDFVCFFLASMGVGVGFAVLLTVWAERWVRPTRPHEWVNQPTLEEARQICQEFQTVGWVASLFFEIFLLIGMLNYVQISPQGIINSPLMGFVEQKISWENVAKVKIGAKIVLEREGRSSRQKEVFSPHFYLFFNPSDSVNIWRRTIDLTDLSLLRALSICTENNVPILVEYPSIYEKSKWKKLLSEEKFNQVIEFFDTANRSAQGLNSIFKQGDTATYDQLQIRLDSTLWTSDFNLFEYSNDTLLALHFTLTNNGDSTAFFGTLSNLQVIDNQGVSYSISFFAKDQSNAEIPPHTTQKIVRFFNVPTHKTGLKARYEASFLDRLTVIFDLGR